MSTLPLPGLEPPAAHPMLTDRQALALGVIRERGPLMSDELGAYLCERRGKHARDEICAWCSPNGTEVAKALQRKGLVTKKRGEGWLAVGYPAMREASAQIGAGDEWPGDLF